MVFQQIYVTDILKSPFSRSPDRYNYKHNPACYKTKNPKPKTQNTTPLSLTKLNTAVTNIAENGYVLCYIVI